MSFFDRLMSFFFPIPRTREERIREIEKRRENAQLMLEMEREKNEPDPLAIDRYGREITQWDQLLKRLREQPEEPMPQ